MRAQNLQQIESESTVGATPANSRRMAQPEYSGSTDKSRVSVIGADITITGNIEASIDLHIEGKVIGDVHCATLVLAEGSSINGRVFATRAKISGTVQGGLETKDLAVEATGRLMGDATYQRLRIAPGGVIEGKLSQRVAQ